MWFLVLTFDRPKADRKHFLLQLAVGEVQRVPHARLVATRVLLHLCCRHHCAHINTNKTLKSQARPPRSKSHQKSTKKKGGGRGTKVICADLQCLRLTHDEADLGGLLVLQQLDGASTTLLPLVPLLIESIQLGLPVEPHPRVRSKHNKIGSDRIEPKRNQSVGSIAADSHVE